MSAKEQASKSSCLVCNSENSESNRMTNFSQVSHRKAQSDIDFQNKLFLRFIQKQNLVKRAGICSCVEIFCTMQKYEHWYFPTDYDFYT